MPGITTQNVRENRNKNKLEIPLFKKIIPNPEKAFCRKNAPENIIYKKENINLKTKSFLKRKIKETPCCPNTREMVQETAIYDNTKSGPKPKLV